MAEAILMPRLSDTMTEGVIAAWHKNVGDQVQKGDLLAEIETDKATMELESYQDGILLHRGAEDGKKLQVNDLLAILGKTGEDVAALIAEHSGGNNEQSLQNDEVKAEQQPAQKQETSAEQPPAKADEKPAQKVEAPANSPLPEYFLLDLLEELPFRLYLQK